MTATQLATIPSFSLLMQQAIGMDTTNNVIELSSTNNSKKTSTTIELERVYFEHYKDLVSMARVLVDDVNSASDVVQTAFTRALIAQPTFNKSDSLSYMKTAIMNQARSDLRKRGTARKHLSVISSDDVELSTPAEQELSAQAVAVQELLSQLPERQRECIALVHIYSMTHKEIAIQLGISEGSVKQHLSRGIKTLSTALGGSK